MKQLPTTLPSFLWHFAKLYRRFFLGLIGTGLVWAATMTLRPYFLKLLIDGVAVPDARYTTLLVPAVLYVVLLEVANVNYRVVDWIRLRVMPVLQKDITASMFAYVQRHSYRFFQNNMAGNLANKIGDMSRSVGFIIRRLDTFFSRAVALVIASVLLFQVQPYFALVFATWATAFLSLTFYLSRISQTYSQHLAEVRSRVTGGIVDRFVNIVSIHLFAQQNTEQHFLNLDLDETVDKDRQLQRYLLKLKFFQGLSITLLVACLLALLLYYHTQGLVTAGDFAFVLSLVMTFVWDVWMLAGEITGFSEDLGVCNQALAIVAVPHEIIDDSNAKTLHVTDGRIVFDRVGFHYTAGTSIFTNQSVTIAPGEKVGLVGTSGVGKTTFVNLILRFFDVQAGRILIDGQEIAAVTQDSLHQQIAMIPQDPILFHRTLKENIQYGLPGVCDDDVIEAAKKAYCHAFISELANGYDTLVGERGIRLSGGQRQRIAIARAILKSAPILILDEATSALDSETEQHIQESLGHLMQGRTTLVIAHRLSTLSQMDRLLVFQDGQIVEDGSHEQLLRHNGHYARLWQFQSGGFLPEEI